MSVFDSEKMHSAQQANLDALQQISSKMFENVERLSQLQLNALRTLSEEQFNQFNKLLSVRDPQSFTEYQASFTSQSAAQAERLLAFNRQVYELMSSAQADMAQFAERQGEVGTQHVQEMMDQVAKNAPAGAGPAMAVLRSTMDNASSFYKSAQMAMKQAMDMTQQTMASAASMAGQTTQNASQTAEQTANASESAASGPAQAARNAAAKAAEAASSAVKPK